MVAVRPALSRSSWRWCPPDGCVGARWRCARVAQPNRQARRARAKEMAARAAHCRRVAIRRGRRWCTALVDVLAEYGAIGASLPYPSQETLARELGVDERTVRRWLAELETLGLVIVYRTTPERGSDGKWTRRQTNRYLLADGKAKGAAPSCPLPRRRLGASALISPTGHPCPVTASQGSTSGGASEGHAAPPPPEEIEPVGMIEWSSPSAPASLEVELSAWKPPDQEERARIAAIRAGLRSQLSPTRRHLSR